MGKLMWMALCAVLATPMAHAAVAVPEDEIIRVYGSRSDTGWRSYANNPLGQGMPGRNCEYGPDAGDLDGDAPGQSVVCKVLQWTVITGAIPTTLRGWLEFTKKNVGKLLIRVSGLGTAVAGVTGTMYVLICTSLLS